MSRRDDTVSLKDMLEHARECIEMLEGKSRAELAANRMLQLALTRLIEIVGEAANRVSDETQQRHANLPWPKIIGMRNRLIHGYDVIDLDLLWETVATDLPTLVVQLEGIVENRK